MTAQDAVGRWSSQRARLSRKRRPNTLRLPARAQTLLSLALGHQLLGDGPAALSCVLGLRRLGAGAGMHAAAGGRCLVEMAAHPAVALLAMSAHLAAGDPSAACAEGATVAASDAADRGACLGAALELAAQEHCVPPSALQPGGWSARLLGNSWLARKEGTTVQRHATTPCLFACLMRSDDDRLRLSLLPTTCASSAMQCSTCCLGASPLTPRYWPLLPRRCLRPRMTRPAALGFLMPSLRPAASCWAAAMGLQECTHKAVAQI